MDKIHTHPSKRMFGLSLRQASSSLVSLALHKFDLLAEFMVLFPVEVLAPGRAVEDKTA